MKPKVLIVVDSFNSGGVQHVMHRIGRGLSETGFDVSFAVVRPAGPLLGAFAREFTIHKDEKGRSGPSRLLAFLRAFGAYARMFGLRRSNYALGSALRYVPFLTTVLERVRPDVVISTTSLCNVCSLLAREVARSKARIVVSEHVNLSTVLSRRWTDPTALARTVAILRAGYSRADTVIVVSQALKQDLIDTLGLAAAHIQVAYNPALDREFEEKRREPCDEDWLNDKREPVVVAVGRISRQKNYPLLLEAVRIANMTRPVRLLVIGGAEKEKHQRLLAKLREQCTTAGLADRVKFLGQQDNPVKYLSKADGLVLSSDYEGFGLVLVEALGCGIPVVSTDCPDGPREILGDGAYGRLAPCGDAGALARALLASLETPPDREKLRARAADFSTEKSVQGYARIVDALLDRSALDDREGSVRPFAAGAANRAARSQIL